ncbi:MAG: alpha/beta hydrolase [Chitinophagales bacterium]|nr:alpha/beta hydrolase [Chitinophagales bacterium]
MVKSLSPIIELIEEEYEIPHLGATRKISALLPYDYYDHTKRLPVLYLQDGQNLFNPQAPFGDWAIDKSLHRLAAKGLKDVIIVAIDHGERERIKEYLPYFHGRLGKGKGTHYIRFLKEKLIPYINKRYRTMTDYASTGIGGSSMGGLISLYAGLTEPSVFGKTMIFSPSLWISNRIYYNAKVFDTLPNSRMYLYAGGEESLTHLPNVKKLESILKSHTAKNSNFHLKVSVNMRGVHAEEYWRREFPKALKWLFFDK